MALKVMNVEGTDDEESTNAEEGAGDAESTDNEDSTVDEEGTGDVEGADEGLRV